LKRRAGLPGRVQIEGVTKCLCPRRSRPQLPYLRRFARALTGSQASGDAYSIATLEAIVDRGLFPGRPACDEAAYLFTAFLKIWSSMSINHKGWHGAGHSPSVIAADRTLEALTPLPRVAFLLRTVEGFMTEEIAEMLDYSVMEVDAAAGAGRQGNHGAAQHRRADHRR
jgi:DNA-directed RNA polymerase specialized sigma24 family protein